MFASDAERRTTSSEDGQVGALGQQRSDIRYGLEKMLAVVEHDERPAINEIATEQISPTLLASLSQSKCVANCGNDKVCAGDGRETDKHQAVDEQVGDCRGNRQRQAGLSNASGPVNVTSRTVLALKSSRRFSMSRSRPINGVGGTGSAGSCRRVQPNEGSLVIALAASRASRSTALSPRPAARR